MTTSLKQLERNLVWVRKGMFVFTSLASFGTVGRRSATSPRSSRSETSARTWAMNGVAARSVAGVDSVPGSASRAKARSAGNDELRLAKASREAASVVGSSSIARPRAMSSAANEPEKVRKLVTKPCSACSFRPRPRTTLSRPLISPRRSPGSVPRNASLTCEVNLLAFGEDL